MMDAIESIKFLKYENISRRARVWSNMELKKFAHLFQGDIINVSGWEDSDKQGKKYVDYFINKKSYTISNYKGDRGFSGFQKEFYLDLEKPLPPELYKKFDVVFNHTTLEHIFDIFTAFKNICDLSRDIIILIIPFVQEVHTCTYSDYWRFTHLCIKKLFERNGLSPLYGSSTKIRNTSIYHFFIASRNPNKWRNIFGEYSNKNMNLGDGILSKNPILYTFSRIYEKINKILWK